MFENTWLFLTRDTEMRDNNFSESVIRSKLKRVKQQNVSSESKFKRIEKKP